MRGARPLSAAPSDAAARGARCCSRRHGSSPAHRMHRHSASRRPWGQLCMRIYCAWSRAGATTSPTWRCGCTQWSCIPARAAAASSAAWTGGTPTGTESAACSTAHRGGTTSSRAAATPSSRASKRASRPWRGQTSAAHTGRGSSKRSAADAAASAGPSSAACAAGAHWLCQR